MKYIMIAPIFALVMSGCSLISDKVTQADAVAHNVDEKMHKVDKTMHDIVLPLPEQKSKKN